MSALLTMDVTFVLCECVRHRPYHEQIACPFQVRGDDTFKEYHKLFHRDTLEISLLMCVFLSSILYCQMETVYVK